MAANKQLNLIGMVSPFCLLAYKAAVARMQPRQILEIRVRDPRVARDLLRIIEHSPDRLLENRRFRGFFQVLVEKTGKSATGVKEEA